MEGPVDVYALARDRELLWRPLAISPTSHSSSHAHNILAHSTVAATPIPGHLISAGNQSHSSRGIKWRLDAHWTVHTQHPWHPQDCSQRSPHCASRLLTSYDDVPMSCTPLHLSSVHWRPPVVYPGAIL